MSAIQGCHGNQLSALCLHELSERLYPDDYRRLGLRLGIEETRLVHHEKTQCGNIQECIYQALVDWTKQDGSGATSHVLVQSLKQIGNRAAAEWLQAEFDSSLSIAPQDDIELICARGNIPSLPDCLTDRPVELAEVRDKLRSISSISSSSSTPSKSSTRWLVVRGMGGMGKSVLVNQAVRDENLIKECYPDGVFWVSIGAAVKGTAEIAERLETLCRTLDDGLLMAPSPPKTKDQWKNLLSRLITQQYPRSLLLLDDVWEQDVIRAFEVRCSVVITTRDAGVHTCAGGRKEEVILSQGFSESQSLQALSNWTETSPGNLPEQAASIHRLSHGSPLVISIIGSLLREHGQRWEYYVTQLQQKNMDKLSTVRDAIHLSIEELPSRDIIMRLFSWFAVFDQGTVLSSKIFSMLEGCSTEEIEDQMKVLTQRHLAISGCQTASRCQTYWLHDLVYDYLVSEKADKDKDPVISNEFKSLMVFNRFRSCRRDMAQTSLCLPQSTSVYKKARTACSAERNGFYVAEVVDRRPKVYSVTHAPFGKYARCAKLLPNGKEILTAGFGRQVQIADIHDGESRTLIHDHAENITDISLSSDGSLLVTCSPAKGVCVWDFSRTDCLLPHVKNITHGDSIIVTCRFVECGGETKLVSGDESGCLKIWNCSFTLHHSIQAHNTAILSCSTCDKEEVVVSCAKDDEIVRVFDVQSGSQTFHIEHLFPLSDCSLLGNGLIVTLVWCQLQIFTARGRRLCRWTGRESSVHYQNLSCASGDDCHYIAVRGVAGFITVLKLGKMFQLTRMLTTHYRLNVGGVYRDVINMWVEHINDGSTSSGTYLVTNQSCGLILVWRLEREKSRPQLDGNNFDVSFTTDGKIRGMVGTKPKSSQKCLMLHPCCVNSPRLSATTILKLRKLETIDSIKITPDHRGEILLCTSERIKVSRVPRCFGIESKRKVASVKTRQEFSVVPSQDKLLLARLMGHGSQSLLTVSSGTGISVEMWSRDGSCTERRNIDFKQGLSADVSHDHTKIAIGCSDSTVVLFSLTNGMFDEGDHTVLKMDNFRVTSCTFSPDDQLLAVAANKHVTVFDVKNLTPLADCCHKTVISGIRFTPNSEFLLIVAGGGLLIHESRTLCRRGKVTAYAEVSDFHFSSDGTMLVTAGAVKYFEKGYLEWWRIDLSGSITQLQKFILNSRVKRVVCNQYFTTFVTVDEVDEIYVLERITNAAVEKESNLDVS